VPADFMLEFGLVINLELSSFLLRAVSLEVGITTLVTDTGARACVRQERSTPEAPA
jgi:hypothetical protein